MVMPDTDICCSLLSYFFKSLSGCAESSLLHGLFFSSCGDTYSCCHALTSHCFSCCGTQVPGAWRLSTCSSLAREDKAQQVWAGRPSWTWIFPDQGWNLACTEGLLPLATKEAPSFLLNPLRRSWNSPEVWNWLFQSSLEDSQVWFIPRRGCQRSSYFRFVHSVIQPTTYCKSGHLIDREMKEVVSTSDLGSLVEGVGRETGTGYLLWDTIQADRKLYRTTEEFLSFTQCVEGSRHPRKVLKRREEIAGQ